MGELVSQLLETLRIEAAGVLQDVVAGGVDGPLPYGLTNQEKVVPDSKVMIPGKDGGMNGITSQAESPRHPPRSHWAGWRAELQP